MALQRLGFVAGKTRRGGSHLTMYRERPDGTKDVTVIVLNQAEVPRGTLRDILKLGKVSRSAFQSALRRRPK